MNSEDKNDLCCVVGLIICLTMLFIGGGWFMHHLHQVHTGAIVCHQ